MIFHGTADYMNTDYDTHFSITLKNFIYYDMSCYGMKTIKIPLSRSELSYHTGKSSDDKQYEVLNWQGDWIDWANCHLNIKIQTWNRKEVFISSIGLKSLITVNSGYKGKDVDLQSTIIILDDKSYNNFCCYINNSSRLSGILLEQLRKNEKIAYANYLAFFS